MFPYSPSSRLCNRKRLSNGPDILLCDFYEHSSLRVGAEQEQLAFGDPVSGSGAAEPLSNRRRKHEADGGPPKCSRTLLRPDFAIEGDYQMNQTSSSAISTNTLHCAL